MQPADRGNATRDTTLKLDRVETAREMAESDEDWRDWDVTAGDGLFARAWADAPSEHQIDPEARTGG